MKPIELRRSIRRYSDKPIDDMTVMQLLESARLAPSGSNSQPWQFILVRDQSIKRALATVSHNQQWMRSAPVFVVGVADLRLAIHSEEELEVDEESPQKELKDAIRDTAIAIEHIVLEATHCGLGTCWVAWFLQDEVRPMLGLSKDKYVVAIVTVGYPAEEPNQRGRRDLKDLIHYERW